MFRDVAGVERPARASGGGCAPDADLGLLGIRTAIGSELSETSAFNFALAAFQIIDADSAIQIFKLCLVTGFATRQQFKELGHGVYSSCSLPALYMLHRSVDV